MSARAAVSAAVLVPCFWQARIQAGDLSSHLYNAWLASVISRGRIEGLEVVPQWTNIAFDRALVWLLNGAGADAAQRIAVAASVLVFFWGAFAFVSAVSGRPRWSMAPLLAALSYGWVFHAGFFNFYLSLGLCLWALALFWRAGAGRMAGAAAMMAVGAIAHPVPVAWAGGLALYVAAARRIRPRYRPVLTAAAVVGLIAMRRYLALHYIVAWSVNQSRNMTGADQLEVFGLKFLPAAVGLLAVWFVLCARLVQTRGWLRVVFGLPMQLCVLTAASIVVLPQLVAVPGIPLGFSFIPDRMSLAVAVLVCAMAGAAATRKRYAALATLLSAVFFVSLYLETRALNRIEDRITEAVTSLPPGRRVVSSLCRLGAPLDPLTHMIDRACIGHCFSFANYEPSSLQFSVRATGRNPVVAATRADVWALETGEYVVRPEDLPLYEIVRESGGEHLYTRPLRAGDVAGKFCVDTGTVSARLSTPTRLSTPNGEKP